MINTLRSAAIEDTDRVLFRRQFIMGPRFIDAPPSWQRVTIRPELCLTGHPDLGVCRVASGNSAITLLGYILDPDDPDASDTQILEGLLQAVPPDDSIDDVLRRTHRLGGRWALIVDNGRRAWLFNDPCGYRQVVHTDVEALDALWCASQPGLIADVAGLEPDDEAMGFIEAYEHRREPGWPAHEYFWPGTTSAFREVKHLLPNHCLDLSTGESHRYWPNGALEPMPLREAVDTNARILRGLIGAAARRFDLALSITAGRDTRVLLAASREVRDRLYYFTLTDFWNQTADGADVIVPAALLARLGLKHAVVHCPPEMTPEFEQVYRRNVSTAHGAYGPLGEALFRQYPQERVCMKGNAIPIARARYALRGMGRDEATAEGLARSFAVSGNAFAIRAFAGWLAGLPRASGIPLMDLFYWEHIEGCWQAMSQLEWDIAQEVFVPYNNRALLANSLAVPERYRSSPRYVFFDRLISALWPEVLRVPINPHDPHHERRTVRSRVREVLIRTNMYRFVPDRLKRSRGSR